jgi:tellurite resistance protein TerC
MPSSIGTDFSWGAFLAVILVLLAIDLGIYQRRAHKVSVREAFAWSATWFALSVSFGIWIYLHSGSKFGLEFFAGYLIEYALSVDNVFVFILILSFFAVPEHLHHRVLFWGILGALVLRGLFIVIGAALLSAFHWVLYLFGGFLVFTGIKIVRQGETQVEPEKNPMVRLFRKIIPMTVDYSSNSFVTREGGKILATPLALVLVTVETSDLLFATDSIPAIFGVTRDPFIVYTSNICAILGLRSMYFLLAAVIDRFAYLGRGVGVVLLFIGLKMLAADYVQLPTGISLAVVVALLCGAVGLSLLRQTNTPGDTSKP